MVVFIGKRVFSHLLQYTVHSTVRFIFAKHFLAASFAWNHFRFSHGTPPIAVTSTRKLRYVQRICRGSDAAAYLNWPAGLNAGMLTDNASLSGF